MSNYKPKVSIACPECGDEIYSHFSGHFNTCSCDKCFVDETEYYSRNSVFGIVGVMDERNFIWTTAEGLKIKVKDLTVDHAKNILIYIEKRVAEEEGEYRMYGRGDTKLEFPYIYWSIKTVHGL